MSYFGPSSVVGTAVVCEVEDVKGIVIGAWGRRLQKERLLDAAEERAGARYNSAETTPVLASPDRITAHRIQQCTYIQRRRLWLSLAMTCTDEQRWLGGQIRPGEFEWGPGRMRGTGERGPITSQG